jgi:hypothetical protein
MITADGHDAFRSDKAGEPVLDEVAQASRLMQPYRSDNAPFQFNSEIEQAHVKCIKQKGKNDETDRRSEPNRECGGRSGRAGFGGGDGARYRPPRAGR